MKDRDTDPVVFTPSNEPYLGRHLSSSQRVHPRIETLSRGIEPLHAGANRPDSAGNGAAHARFPRADPGGSVETSGLRIE